MPNYKNYPEPEKFPLAVKLLEHDTLPLDTFQTHEFSEIILVSHGSGIHQSNGKKQPICENDVLAIHPGTENCFSNGDQLEIFVVLYDNRVTLPVLDASNLSILKYLYPQKDFFYDQSAPITRIPDYDHDLYLNLFRRLSYETHRKRIGSNVMIPTMFTELIVYLSRGSSPMEEKEKERLWLLQSPVEYLNGHPEEKLDLGKLCHLAGMSERNLFRHFQRVLGMSPNRYLQKIRIQRAMELLERTNRSPEEIAMECGFYDGAHFRKVFRSITGEPPTLFRKKSRGV